MISKSLVAISVFAALALATTLSPSATAATSPSQVPCAAKKPQKLLSSPPPQRRENRRAPIFSPPKTLKGKPMW